MLLNLLQISCSFDSQEEEEKESLAWKVLSEEQTQALKELTVHELEVYVEFIIVTVYLAVYDLQGSRHLLT